MNQEIEKASIDGQFPVSFSIYKLMLLSRGKICSSLDIFVS